MKLRYPKVFLVGETKINLNQLVSYLRYTGQEEFYKEEFYKDIEEAQNKGISEMEILCSFYAKLCYAALTAEKNENISKVRSIHDNILGTIRSGHGSVFEHASFNFVVTDCSRVFTHELVRHRVGTAFSQTSGRYVRGEEINFIQDPILANVSDAVRTTLEFVEKQYRFMVSECIDEGLDFATKKEITSALRRMLPNGQSNEIGFSCNLRSLRHIITMRTSRHAEWEIRYVFNQIVNLVKGRCPVFFEDLESEHIDGLNEYTFKHRAI